MCRKWNQRIARRRLWAVARTALLGAVLLSGATAAYAQPRVALVVGNNAYLRVPPLRNAVNDAAAVSTSCESSDFK